MDVSEKYGTSIEEATQLALDDLGIQESEAVVTVLEEPTSGFFGVGAKVAKVRVEKLSSFNAANEGLNKGYSEQEGKRQETQQTYKKRDLRKKPYPQADNSSEKGGGSYKQSKPPYAPRKNDYGKRDFQKKSFEKVEPVFAISKESVFDKSRLTEIEEHEMLTWTRELLASMQCELEAKAYTGEDFIYIEMTGRDSRTIIGKRGSTLNSIQYIANIVYNKQKDDYERVILDVEGYRVKREKSLEVIAQRMSTKVVRSGRPVKLEPMNPYERKIIHAALQYSTQVFTKSEGEEPFRRVVILRKR